MMTWRVISEGAVAPVANTIQVVLSDATCGRSAERLHPASALRASVAAGIVSKSALEQTSHIANRAFICSSPCRPSWMTRSVRRLAIEAERKSDARFDAALSMSETDFHKMCSARSSTASQG